MKKGCIKITGMNFSCLRGWGVVVVRFVVRKRELVREDKGEKYRTRKAARQQRQPAPTAATDPEIEKGE